MPIRTPDELSETESLTRFGDDSRSIAIFEEILNGCLYELFSELSGSNWYVREHAIVNLFAFGYRFSVPEARTRSHHDRNRVSDHASLSR